MFSMPASVSRRRLLQLAAGTAVIGGTGVLASCGGTGGVSKLTGSLTTRWREDPFARGSYSYLAAGSTPLDRDAIAAPVGDQLFFAGNTALTVKEAVVGAEHEQGLVEFTARVQSLNQSLVPLVDGQE